MALKFLLGVALLLCAEFLATSGQEISPTPTIAGNVNESVLIMCTSFAAGQSLSNILQIYIPGQGSFATFSSSRLMSNSEIGGSITNYTFGPLEAADNGTIFRCSSSSMTSATSTVFVNFPPVITRSSPPGESGEMIVAPEGMTTFNVMLTVMGNPLPTYTWTRNGTPFSDDRITLSRTSIMFSEVRREDMGTYTLTVMNIAGRDTHSFFLSVTFIPEFVGSIAQNFNCSTQVPVPMTIPCASYPGRDGQFMCDVAGNPTATVNATTEGVQNTDNVDTTDATAISVTGVVAMNAGYYVCTATSDVGSATQRIRFYVGGTPQGVSNISNISVSVENVTITVVYNNSVNPVPATTMYAEVFRRTGAMELVWQDYMTINSSIYYTFTVPIDIVRGVVTQEYTARASVENLQGNSTAVDGLFRVNRSIVLAGSPLVSLLFLAVVFLSYQ